MGEKFKTTGVGKGSGSRISDLKKFGDNLDYIRRNDARKKKRKKALKKIDKFSK